MPAALIWLIAALALAGAEALTGDLFLLMLSGGALAAVGSSLVFDELGLGRRRRVRGRVGPAAGRWCGPRCDGGSPRAPGCRSRSKALEGKSALVLDRVGRHEGQVKLDGEVWTARPLNDDDVYEPGDHVTVVRIDGATAVVFKSSLNTREEPHMDGAVVGLILVGGAGDLRDHRRGQVGRR